MTPLTRLRYSAKLFLLCLPALLSAKASLAESTDTAFEDWYQIEIVIFERKQPSTYEQWSNHPNLAYPFKLQGLNDSVGAGDASTTPFIKIASDQRQLNNHANSLQRQRDYRVLLHEAWRQPIAESNQASSILILGGDQFGQHYELEGSIKLSLSRYLHIETNLWFSTFNINYGNTDNTQDTAASNRKSLPPIPTPGEHTEEEMDYEMDYSAETRLTPNNSSSRFSSLNTGFSADTNTQAVEASPYIIKTIYPLQQKRRMRSNELHYIDHPKLGLLIQIKPYSGPEQTTKDSDLSSP